MNKYILSLDQGTTSSRAIVFDIQGNNIASSNKEFEQQYPKEGWVEHDPDDIYGSQLFTLHDVIRKSKIDPSEIASIGITNQRETTILWNRTTGEPVYNAIVWQCRRTAEYCSSIKEQYGDMIFSKTGLLVDAYFSATKLRWILKNVKGVQELADKGEICFGTVDTWLMYKLSGGKIHATDYTNASRTMLFNINTLDWDDELLSLFEIPRSVLPEVKNSSDNYGVIAKNIIGREIPITGVAGDQQAALFGQCCFDKGTVKNTYGTGGFLLMNTGDKPVFAKTGLLTTIACSREGKPAYALEGSVFICGAAIQWLRDGLKLIDSAADSEYFASKVKDTGGVYIVPAFVGLGAPYWDSYARGSINGLTRATTKNHIVRAVLESMAYQTFDVLKLIQDESGIEFSDLRVDGGASANNLLLQFQADILGVPVHRPSCIETTALGAAYLAGLGVGVYKSVEEILEINREITKFVPNMDQETKENRLKYWHKAVSRSLMWKED